MTESIDITEARKHVLVKRMGACFPVEYDWTYVDMQSVSRPIHSVSLAHEPSLHYLLTHIPQKK